MESDTTTTDNHQRQQPTNLQNETNNKQQVFYTQ